MIISTDEGKAFDEIQHLFFIKTLIKVGVEETYLNMVKAHLWQTHTYYVNINIHLLIFHLTMKS